MNTNKLNDNDKIELNNIALNIVGQIQKIAKDNDKKIRARKEASRSANNSES